MPENNKPKMRYTTYKGSKTIAFGEADDARPFSFGAEKARKLLAAAKAHGLPAVFAAIEKLVNEKDAKKAEQTAVEEIEEIVTDPPAEDAPAL